MSKKPDADVIPVLIESLKFYADETNYNEEYAPGNYVGHASGDDVWEYDYGEIARRALSLIEKHA